MIIDLTSSLHFYQAYDALAPVVGLETSPDMNGMKVAELVFPSVDTSSDSVVLQLLPGQKMNKNFKAFSDEPARTPSELTRRQKIQQWLLSKRSFLSSRQNVLPDFLRASGKDGESKSVMAKVIPPYIPLQTESHASTDKSAITSFLPAIQHGSVPLVSERLQTYLDKRGKDV